MKPLFVAVLSGILLAACSPQPRKTEVNPVPVVATPAAPQPAQNPVRQPAVPAPRAAVPVPPRAFDESLLRGREFLLEARGPAPVLRDAEIGELNRDAGQIQAVEGLFRDASDGALEADRLEPRWAAFLQGWAGRFKAEGWTDPLLRVGAALPTEGGVTMVPVLVSSAGKSVKGWVALVPEGKGYRVSDVQLVEVPRRETPFDPETQVQEISSPNLR